MRAEVGGGGFRAGCHKLSTRVLRVSETPLYNLAVTVLSIPSSTPESDPLQDDHIGYTSGTVAAALAVTSLFLRGQTTALRGWEQHSLCWEAS